MPYLIAGHRGGKRRVRLLPFAGALLATFLPSEAPAQLVTSIWIGSALTGTGNWSNNLLWDIAPINNHNATINNTLFPAIVTLDTDATVNNLSIGSGATLLIANGRRLTMLGTLTNDGIISLLSTGNHTDIKIDAAVTLTGSGTISMGDSKDNRFEGSASGLLTIGVNQTIAGAGIIGRDNLDLVNQGTIAAIHANPLEINVRGKSFTNHGTLKAAGSGGLLLVDESVTNQGTIEVGAGSSVAVSGNFTQSGGSSLTRLAGGSFSATSFALQGGALSGHGTITGAVSTTGTTSIIPGGVGSTGTLVFKSTLSLGGTTTTFFDLGGTMPGSGHDRIDGTTIFLNGALSLSFVNGFESVVTSTDSLTLINASTALNGSFASLANGTRLTTADGLGSFQVNYSTTALTLSNFQPIPEPSTYVLLSIGAAGLLLAERRRRRKHGAANS